MSYNVSTINGNLVRKPVIAEGGKYGFMTVAVQRNFKNKEGTYDSDFINVMISGEKLAEFYATHFEKGDGVIVQGELSTKPNKFDPEGKATELTLTTRVFPSFAHGKKSSNASGEPVKEATTPADEFETACDADDDLPF